MSNAVEGINDFEEITDLIGFYIEGAKSGVSDTMAKAFHRDATIFGYIGEDLFAGPIQNLFDWNTENGAAADLKESISSIDISGTAATVRVEIENWTGNRFTDMFTLLKVEGQWKIMNKVFNVHS